MAIGADETAAEVFRSLAAVGAELMVETLAGLEAGTLVGRKQDEAQATLAPILTREDGAIDFSRTARHIYDRWRGFQPWPGAHTRLRGKKLIVHRMHVGAESGTAEGVLRVVGEEMAAGCGGRGSVVFDEVQLEGKRRMSAAEFLHGFHVKTRREVGGLSDVGRERCSETWSAGAATVGGADGFRGRGDCEDQSGAGCGVRDSDAGGRGQGTQR